MTKTEPMARTGEGLSGSPAEMVRTALAGFIGEFNDYQDEMKVKLQQQEERLTMLDRKSISAGRPALSTSADEGAPHRKAIAAYLRSGDTLVVWKLDRLGRSMSHLIEKVGELATRGIGFRSLTENIDTTTSGGMLVFNIFGSLAQFERDLIRERTHAGLKAARERGRPGGRRPVVTPDKLRKAREHIASGLTVREAAARLKIGKTALYKALEATEKNTKSQRSRSVRS